MNNEETLKELGFYDNLCGTLKPNWVKTKEKDIKPFDDNVKVIKGIKHHPYKNVKWSRYLGKPLRVFIISEMKKGIKPKDILNKVFGMVKYKPTGMTQKHIKHLINRNIETTISRMKKEHYTF